MHALFHAAAHNPDAALNTARHLFFKARTGILVRVKGGHVDMWCPFANKDYRNAWAHKVVFPCGAKSVGDYAALKARSTALAPEPMLAMDKWWLNGGVVCNVMPDCVWGSSYNKELLDMIQQTASAAVAMGNPLPDAVFFLNKRDYPVVPANRHASPYQRFTGPVAEAPGPGAHLVVFSFYTGANVADVPMPIPDDWAVGSKDKCEQWAALRESAPFLGRRPAAVFRGSATGGGHRARLVAMRDAPGGRDLVDFALTSVNARDRVQYDPVTDTMAVAWEHKKDYSHLLGAPMTLQDQAACFRYIVYMDGHSAAARYGTLMHTGCTILRVQSGQTLDCGHLWLFDRLQGAQLGDPAHVWAVADHVLIAPDLSNLLDTIRWLNECPAVAAGVAENAARRAPTRDTILQYWDRALRTVHDTCALVPEALGTGRVWWGAVDKRYGQLDTLG